MKKVISMALVVAMLIGLVACGGSVPKNTVNSADDLEGKTIGVQLGTTGDIYASGLAEEDASGKTKIEK